MISEIPSLVTLLLSLHFILDIISEHIFGFLINLEQIAELTTFKLISSLTSSLLIKMAGTKYT